MQKMNLTKIKRTEMILSMFSGKKKKIKLEIYSRYKKIKYLEI